MSLPDGVVTATVTFGPYVDDAGRPHAGRLTFTSSTARVTTPGGEPIVPRPLCVELDADGAGSVVLPVTDQVGFVNDVGLPVTNWTYSVLVELDGVRSERHSIALPTGGEPGKVFDLDLMVAVPGSTGDVDVPTVVTSVAGYTGDVSVEELIAAGLGGGGGVTSVAGYTGDVSVEQLNAAGVGGVSSVAGYTGAVTVEQLGNAGLGFQPLVLDSPDSPVPAGTPDGTLVLYRSVPPTTRFDVPLGLGNVVYATGADGVTSDLVFSIPGNATVGDLLLVHVASQSAETAAVSGFQAPGGWSQVLNSWTSGTLQAGRHYAVFAKYIDTPATLAALGAAVTVSGDNLAGSYRHGGILVRVTKAAPSGFAVGRSPYAPMSADVARIVLADFTATQPTAGVLAMVWANTSADVPQSDASIADPAWVKVGRVAAQVGAGSPPAASEMVLWWRAAADLYQAPVTVVVEPPSTGVPVGIQYAIRGV